MLDQVTTVILTYNEIPNINRTLAALQWAGEIVVVDSGSDDGTVEYCESLPNVRVINRKFDTHSQHWNFAVAGTGIESPWILAMDADYLLTPRLRDEMAALDPPPGVKGYRVNFFYCVFGQRLRGNLYPPVTVLFRNGSGHYQQDGHTQRLVLDGEVRELANRMLHDDRKDSGRWLVSQYRYAELEVDLLMNTPWSALRWQDRLRCCMLITPWLVPLYCLVLKGGVLDGPAGWYYAMQRGLAEGILSLCLLERRIRGKAGKSGQ